MNPTAPAEPVFPRIFAIRGESVMLDSDLAILYGVETRGFNQAIARNVHRFPADFAFQLTRQEFANLMFQFGTSSSHGGRRYQPWVVTEHGAIMAATILNSEGRPVDLSEPATEWDALGSQFVILKMVGGTTLRQAGQGV